MQPSARHMGPTAQDFRATFGLGASAAGIDTVDADGVALAAIQGLREQVLELRDENVALRARLEVLENRSGCPREVGHSDSPVGPAACVGGPADGRAYRRPGDRR